MGRPSINLGIIIQARIGSTRLPGKILLPIHAKPLLDHILRRLSQLRLNATTVIATSNQSGDDVVEAFCRDRGVTCFRGSEWNVLERFYRCTQLYEFTHIIRLTGDNPFVDVEELERLVALHIKNGNDYSHSFGVLPVGVGAEIFTFAALEKSFLEGHRPNHIEHVNEYIQEHPDKFKTGVLEVIDAKNRPDVRLTVDTEADYRKACYIAKAARSEPVSTEEAIELCSRYA